MIWILKTVLRKIKYHWKTYIFYFKTYYKATAIKTVWYGQKVRHTDQWDRVESPQINLYIHGQLIFFRVIEEYIIDMANWLSDKGAKTLQQGKDCLFNTWYWEYWISTCKRKKSGEFHSGPVVRTQHIDCHGPDSIPSGEDPSSLTVRKKKRLLPNTINKINSKWRICTKRTSLVVP